MVKYLLTFAAAILLFAACQKEKEGIDNFPMLVTNPMVDVDSSGITLNMAFTSKGSFKIQEAGFCIDSTSIKSFTAEKSTTVDDLTNESSYSKRIKRLFLLGEKYYVRSYVKVKDAIIFGNEVSFTGQRDIAPKITGCTPNEGLHPIDTIYVKGENFEFYKDKMNAVLFKEYGWDDEKVQLNIKYLDKNTLKVYGPIKQHYKLKVQFDKISITSNTYFKLNELKNFKIDKAESYPGDTITLSWENALDKRDSWNLKINDNTPQIVEQSDKFIKVKLPKNPWGWTVNVTYNSQKIYNSISCKSPFNDIRINEELKTGDKITIKTNYPIDESDVFAAYHHNFDYFHDADYSITTVLRYINNRTLELTIPDDIKMEKTLLNSDGSVSFTFKYILGDYLSREFNHLTFNYKSNIGIRLGDFDFQNDIIAMVIENNRCNYILENIGGSFQLENRTNLEENPLYLPNYMNACGIAKDPKNGKIYFGYSYNSRPAEICVTDNKFHYLETIPFYTGDLLQILHASFYLNNKLYFLGYSYWGVFGTTYYRDVYSLDLSTKEYNKEKIILPWKGEFSTTLPYSIENGEIAAIQTHLVNDDIFIELLSIGKKSIYKLNQSSMQFEYFGDFPNNPNNSKMYSYEFNNKWCILVDDMVWAFDGNTWMEWTKTPANCTLYFENNGKKYFKVKDLKSLYMLPL